MATVPGTPRHGNRLYFIPDANHYLRSTGRTHS
jgi:hypothetical protein